MFLKFISSHILEYRRLRVELDLIDSSLGNKYPYSKNNNKTFKRSFV